MSATSSSVPRRLAVVAAIVAFAFAALYAYDARCERECDEAERAGSELYARGDHLTALRVALEADRGCDCNRFYEGDEPALHALVGACVRELLREGRRTEAREIMVRTGGPIAHEFEPSVR